MTGFVLWIMATLGPSSDVSFRRYNHPDALSCEIARQLTESAMRTTGYRDIETRCEPAKKSSAGPLT
jgi:hypothetical protein